MTFLVALQKLIGENRIRQNEPMAMHTTFKIGGPAEFYVDTERIDELVALVNTARQYDAAVFVFGQGSNIIVADSGIGGLVIKNNCRKFDVVSMSGKVRNQSEGLLGHEASWQIDVDKAVVYAEAGTIMSQLVRFTVDQGFCGLEYQLGLPGTVGGGVYMNSNWPKTSSFVGDCLYSARILGSDGNIKEVNRSYFQFGYDYSALQKTHEIVLSVVFKFNPMDKKILWQRATEALEYRTASQPKGASAGCTFRNISLADAMHHATVENVASAGYFIDKAGLKGKRIGDAMISDMHANFIVNMGAAKAKDVIALVELMKQEVHKKFGVELALEVWPIGFD